MSITEKEEKLFKLWEAGRKDFVRDGVILENDYSDSFPKIAFILKEVNDPGGGGWDLREFVAEGGRAQTWNNIARWVHGIKNRNNIPNWGFYSEISEDFRKEILKGICVINLKKSPGTHITNMRTLESAAESDKEYIRRQYALYEPDLTICCGTGDLFKKVVGHGDKKWRQTKRGIWWYERDVGKYVVSFAHPEARVCSPLLIYGLLDAVNEILA